MTPDEQAPVDAQVQEPVKVSVDLEAELRAELGKLKKDELIDRLLELRQPPEVAESPSAYSQEDMDKVSDTVVALYDVVHPALEYVRLNAAVVTSTDRVAAEAAYAELVAAVERYNTQD